MLFKISDIIMFIHETFSLQHTVVSLSSLFTNIVVDMKINKNRIFFFYYMSLVTIE